MEMIRQPKELWSWTETLMISMYCSLIRCKGLELYDKLCADTTVDFTYFQPITMNFRKKSYMLPSLLQERGEKYLYLCIYFIHKTCLFSFSSTLVIFSLTTDSGYWKHYMRIQNYDSKQHPASGVANIGGRSSNSGLPLNDNMCNLIFNTSSSEPRAKILTPWKRIHSHRKIGNWE